MTVNTGAPQLSGFDQWDSATYLTDYYSRVERDEQLTLKFLLQEFKRIEPPAVALEFGVGPTLHHALALSPYVTEIHAADYLRSNLHQVRSWMLRQRAAHDWKPFTRHILACEGGVEATELEVQRRETLTRGRVKRLLLCDAAQAVPIPTFRGVGYEVVVSCYCAESATADRSTWRRYMTNIFGLLRPGGLFVMAALRKCRRYKVGDNYFPCADVDETDVAMLFEQNGFNMRRTRLRVEPVPEQRALGYEGILLASGMLTRPVARTSNGAREAQASTTACCPSLLLARGIQPRQ